MAYKLIYSKTFDSDVENVYKYISKKFKSPQSVHNLSLKIVKVLENVQLFPQAFSKLNIQSKKLYRFALCNNYVIIYRVKGSEIHLDRFLYAKSNIKERLKENKDE